jgi:hypothetical protein
LGLEVQEVIFHSAGRSGTVPDHFVKRDQQILGLIAILLVALGNIRSCGELVRGLVTQALLNARVLLAKRKFLVPYFSWISFSFGRLSPTMSTLKSPVSITVSMAFTRPPRCQRCKINLRHCHHFVFLKLLNWQTWQTYGLRWADCFRFSNPTPALLTSLLSCYLVPRVRSRLKAALMRARCVKACGKLPRACPCALVCSA